MSPNLPLAPQIGSPSRPGNPILDWLDIKDSSGAALSQYRLMLDPPFYSMLSNICGVIAEFCYALFLLATTVATALLQIIVQPRIWLEPLEHAYMTVTEPIYRFAPPQLIVIAAFAILVFQVYVIRSGPAPAATRQNKTPTLMDQWIPSNTQIARAQWDRLIAGGVLMLVVMALASNPFTPMRKLLECIVGFGEMLSPTGGTGSAAGYQGASALGLIRTVTFLINYRDTLDSECAQQWAWSINSGAGNPTCLTASQVAATRPDVWTAILAAAALPVGWYLLKFAGMALKRFLNYATLAVAYTLGTAYVAAVTVGRRRPYDPLITTASHAGTNLVMAAVVTFIVVVIPSAIFGLINGIMSLIPHTSSGLINGSVAAAQVAAVTGAYYGATKILARYMEIKESVFQVFKDRTSKHGLVTNLYDLKSGDKTFTGPLASPLASSAEWAKSKYESGVEWSKSTGRNVRGQVGQYLRDQVSQYISTQPGGDMTQIIEDTPEMQGAQEIIALTAAGGARSRVDVDRLIAEEAERRPEAQLAAPPRVFLDSQDQLRLAPAPPRDIPADGPTAAQSGGGASPAAAAAVPRHRASGASPDREPVAVGKLRLADLPGLYGEQLRREAARLGAAADSQRDETSQHEAATALYSAPTVGSSAGAGSGSAPSARQRGAHELSYTMVLSSAAWAQSVQHQRNLMAARGIPAVPGLSEEVEGEEHVIFGEKDGRLTMVRKHDRGFGDQL